MTNEKPYVVISDYKQNEGRYMQPELGFEPEPLDSARMMGSLEQSVLLQKAERAGANND